MEKPRNIVIAVNLQWAGLAIGVIATVFALVTQYPKETIKYASTPIFLGVLLLITVAVQALLIFKIAAGRNWARILLAVSFVMGLFQIPALLTESPMRVITFSLQTILQGYGLFLLFTKPGSTWFSKHGKA